MRIKKETFERLHGLCCRGEKHNSLINRLIAVCESEEKDINISEETCNRLLKHTSCKDIDEALNLLMDKYRVLKK